MSRPALLDGRYQLLKEIGRGGIGVLWEGQQEPLGRAVAVKFLRGHAKKQRDKLLAEAQAVARIEHPHIVKVYDVGTDGDGSPYVVMELLRGPSLAAHIDQRGPLSSEETARIALQLCEALTAAHQQGLVHQDVKPANILAIQATVPKVWKLVDFGLSTHSVMTPISGGPVRDVRGGTPGYMPPEQIRGDPVDARSDIYALGCVLHELLTGRRAFGGRNSAEIMKAQLEQTVDEGRGLPKEWRAVLRTAMASTPEQRFASAADFADAIRALSRPLPTATRMHPLLAFVLGVATTLAFVASAVFWRQLVE